MRLCIMIDFKHFGQNKLVFKEQVSKEKVVLNDIILSTYFKSFLYIHFLL